MSLRLAGPYFALRGGSWVVGVRLTRATSRYALDPSDRFHALGLRLLRRAS